MQQIGTVEEVVDALGGDTQVAAWLGISQPAVAQWKIRGEIPGGWHMRIYIRLLSMGLDCDPKVFGLSAEDALALRNAHNPARSKRQRPTAHA